MVPIAWHLSLSLDPRTCTLDDAEACRELAATVLDCGDPFGLLAFRVQGHQLRALVQGEKSSAGDFARHLRICLSYRMHLGSDFQTVRLTPVDDRKQLYWQLLHVLRGAALPERDALAEASNLHDLLGFRSLGDGTRSRLAELLPDLEPAALRRLLPTTFVLPEARRRRDPSPPPTGAAFFAPTGLARLGRGGGRLDQA